MKNRLGLILVILGIALIGVALYYFREPPREEVLRCNTDSDCTLELTYGCCPSTTAINKKYEDYWNRMRELNPCPEMVYCKMTLPVYDFEPECVKNLCQASIRSFAFNFSLSNVSSNEIYRICESIHSKYAKAACFSALINTYYHRVSSNKELTNCAKYSHADERTNCYKQLIEKIESLSFEQLVELCKKYNEEENRSLPIYVCYDTAKEITQKD